MSQYNERKSSETGRSRAKGRSYGRNAAASRNAAGTGRNTASAGRRSASSGGRRRNRRRRRSGGNFLKIAVGGVLLILAISCIVFLMGKMKEQGEGKESSPENMITTQESETELQKQVYVDGIDITGMSREQAREAILKNYPWDMKVTWQEESYEVSDLMAGKVDALLEDVFTGEPEERYVLDTEGLDEAIRQEAAAAASRWDKPAKNGSISSYDASSDRFLFTGAESGYLVDQEKLAADIADAVGRKEFDVVIEAAVNAVEPEFSEAVAKEKYKTIASFTTKTTSNSKRNTNIRLASQALNGTVLQPGEEFSFNEVVGQRTAEKGYQGAAAYNNGEVVEEIGGGVCQVSSTLYNAVLKAGLKTTFRRSHTYEPSYVTPGTDAAISWGGPDYKFVNNSNAAIGIRASYADQTMKISIYGIPLLEEGMEYSLKSTKVKDVELAAPVYQEDPSLQPGVEEVEKAGSQGSQWETRLVITKNGEVVSQEVDHRTSYKGHTSVIRRNTSGTVAETLPGEGESGGQVIDPSESASVAPEGAADGFANPETPGTSASEETQGEDPQGEDPRDAVSAGPPSGTASATIPASGPGGMTERPGIQASGNSALQAPGAATETSPAAPGPQNMAPIIAPKPEA